VFTLNGVALRCNRSYTGSAMPLISVTRLRLRSWWILPLFNLRALQSALQARKAPGNLAISLLRDADHTFWARTVWRDESAMRSFMLSGAHRRAMSRISSWCNEAATVHWTQDSAEPPSWQEAHRRLLEQGRPTKTSVQSDSQRQFAFPSPHVKRELKLK
jgi:hypothetical protein